MRPITYLLAIAPLLLAGCDNGSRPDQIARAKQQYLAAKAACETEFRTSLTLQSDCRSRAADAYIRPWYRYGDLMTGMQEKRRALALQVDAHAMSRAEFNRQIAKAEKAVAREEARRNENARFVSAPEGGTYMR